MPPGKRPLSMTALKALGLKSLGQRLQNARRACRLTQEAVGEKLGVSLHTVSNWEGGRNEPTEQHLEELVQLYGVPVEELVRAAAAGAGGPLPVSSVPLRGYVAAGAPREAYELDLGAVPVPAAVLQKHPQAFALVVSGDSLSGDGISDGDVLLVDPEAGLQVGKIYIVRLPDGEVCARHVHLKDGAVRLRASNGTYKDLDVIQADILGRVVWHLRKM